MEVQDEVSWLRDDQLHMPALLGRHSIQFGPVQEDDELDSRDVLKLEGGDAYLCFCFYPRDSHDSLT